MAAARLNLTIEQGATFSRTIVLKDSDDVAVDLTGYSVAGQLRPTYSSNTAYDFDIEITDAAAGTITWTMDAATTSAISTVSKAKFVYDLELTNGSGEVERLLFGDVEITPEVTR
jgi:hypothetical protein